MQAVARRVNGQRRVGLPKLMALPSGIEPGGFVTVSPSSSNQHGLVISPTGTPPVVGALRDPGRPRMVTTVLQVTLPQAQMERIGLAVNQWVFLRSLGAGAGLLLEPQSAVELVPKGADWAGLGVAADVTR